MYPRTRPPLGEPLGFTGGSESKEPACDAGDLRLIPDLGRFPGEESGNPFQYSCLENPMDGGTWLSSTHSITESDTTMRLLFISYWSSLLWQSLSVDSLQEEEHGFLQGGITLWSGRQWAEKGAAVSSYQPAVSAARRWAPRPGRGIWMEY